MPKRKFTVSSHNQLLEDFKEADKYASKNNMYKTLATKYKVSPWSIRDKWENQDNKPTWLRHQLRNRRIWLLHQQGKSVSEIADVVYLSDRTIKSVLEKVERQEVK